MQCEDLSKKCPKEWQGIAPGPSQAETGEIFPARLKLSSSGWPSVRDGTREREKFRNLKWAAWTEIAVCEEWCSAIETESQSLRE
jgi:hypothetical protein